MKYQIYIYEKNGCYHVALGDGKPEFDLGAYGRNDKVYAYNFANNLSDVTHKPIIDES